MAGSTLVAGHGLRHEGRYWNGLAYVSGGMAPGRCTCGDRSEPLPTGAARKRWHREHKDEIRAQREASGR
jgi:hypothetical protein